MADLRDQDSSSTGRTWSKDFGYEFFQEEWKRFDLSLGLTVISPV